MSNLKVIGWLIVMLMLITACGQSDEPALVEDDVVSPTEAVASITEVPTTVTVIAPTETAVPSVDVEPTATALPAATEAPAPTDTPEPLVMDNCMSCHSDKDMLIDTAAPEEEKEPSESSGVG